MADNKRNSSPTPLDEINVFPNPAGDVELTEEERALLEDPDWITEDESEIIVCERRLAAEGHRARPFWGYLKSRGYVVVEG